MDGLAVLDRPEVGFAAGWRFDRVLVASKQYLVDRNQRDPLERLLVSSATPSTAGMKDRGADWYRNPWSFSQRALQPRCWGEAAWTRDVHPQTGTT